VGVLAPDFNAPQQLGSLIAAHGPDNQFQFAWLGAHRCSARVLSGCNSGILRSAAMIPILLKVWTEKVK
jgi:hypothetical protein